MTNTKKSFSIREVLGASWQIYKRNPLYFIGLALLPIIIIFVFQVVFSGVQKVALLPFSSAPQDVVGMVSGFFELIKNVLSWAVNGTVTLMLVGVYLSYVRGQPKPFRQTAEVAVRRMIPYGIASLLNGVVLFVGFLFLIIPGIFLMVSLQFYTYFILDCKAGIVQSLRNSWALTHGVKGKLLLFSLAVMGLNFIGVILLGVGILVTLPVSMLAGAMVYDRLLEQTPELTATA